jgi:competence protein ComEA
MDKKILLIEAIDLAGGYTEKADLTFVHRYLPLSGEVKPTQKIYVPAIDEEYSINSISTGNNGIDPGSIKINLNTADQKALMSITGVGEVTANKIIELRPINELDDLKKLSGVPQKTIENIKKKAQL